MISIKDLSLKLSPVSAFRNFNWEVRDGQNWLITGPSGSGKSALLKILDGTLYGFSGGITHHFGNHASHSAFELKKYAAFAFFKDKQITYKDFYYQQRYNSSDVEGTFTVRDFIFKGQKPHHQDFLKELTDKLKVGNLLNREFIKLSNGETRKAFIIKALLKNPRILFLDNPYRGIDVPGRQVVNELINRIASEGIQVIMTGSTLEYPSSMTHILDLGQGQEGYAGKLTDYTCPPPGEIPSPPDFPFGENPAPDSEIAFRFTHLTVRYGQTTIIDQLNWTVKEGEKWVLSGTNGSGKSMLLSLVFADHPQAYANEIIIFGKKRGKGSSIWEIKEKMAYVSPEMQCYFDANKTIEAVFASVLNENPYNKKPFTGQHKRFSMALLDYFGKEHLIRENFGTISTGEQNLVLFLRALMKNTPLLLLDEPFQDFDREMVEKAKRILGEYIKNRTLVMITHKKEEIPDMTTRFAELKDGKLLHQLT
ncbi:MAG: ATP-binding cassette domain-containing protein [Cyclobacteriaceae bacterium]|nr:ATP-binding cassette domain-containing protein [Cyclobacteriaceae bacterium]